MANYAQISTGSYNYDDTKKAQELLNTHGYGLETDGIFGPKTEAAVRNYQTAKSLQSDGIIGKNTWASLLSGSNSANTASGDSTPSYNTFVQSDATTQAWNKTQQLQKPEQQPFAYQGELDQTIQQILNRDSFSYDPTTDPMYQQYKDLYTRQGQLAMMDTMGQAAALTGGYGSSYSQAAGQQAYQGYLQQLGERLPEFYGMALDRYNAQSDALLNQYSLLSDQQQQAYNNYRDALSDYYTDLGLANDAYYNQLNFDRSAYESDRAFHYQTEQDALAESWRQKEFNEAQRINNASLAMNQEELRMAKQAAATSGMSLTDYNTLIQEASAEAEKGQSHLESYLMGLIESKIISEELSARILLKHFPSALED